MKLTEARRRALEALIDFHPEPAHISNVTNAHHGKVDVCFIYWQSARWLIAEGLAEEFAVKGGFGTRLRLTDKGLGMAEEVLHGT